MFDNFMDQFKNLLKPSLWNMREDESPPQVVQRRRKRRWGLRRRSLHGRSVKSVRCMVTSDRNEKIKEQLSIGERSKRQKLIPMKHPQFRVQNNRSIYHYIDAPFSSSI